MFGTDGLAELGFGEFDSGGSSSVDGYGTFTDAGIVFAASGAPSGAVSGTLPLTSADIAFSVSGVTSVQGTFSVVESGITFSAVGVTSGSVYSFPACAIYVGGNIAIGTDGKPIVLLF